MSFKFLSDGALNQLPESEFRLCMISLRRHEWGQMSLTQKNADTLDWQKRIISNRDVLDLSLENAIEIIRSPHADVNAIENNYGIKLADKVRRHREIVEQGEVLTYFWKTDSPFSQWHKYRFTATTFLIRIGGAEYKKKDLLNDYFPLDYQEYSSAE